MDSDTDTDLEELSKSVAKSLQKLPYSDSSDEDMQPQPGPSGLQKDIQPQPGPSGLQNPLVWIYTTLLYCSEWHFAVPF